MPTTCWNSVPPKETNMLSMRNSSIMFYLFEFCLKIMWNCSLTQQILLKQCPSKGDKYVIDEELQHTDHLSRCSMFYIFEFCLKIMWNCSLTQQILSHSFYDWNHCELFLLSGFLICHAVGWYIELKNQKFWWRIPERKILISGYPKDL